MQKKKEEEDAKKPTKGKPSSFFVMDYDQNSTADPYGNGRVPTTEQRIFIFTHYPTESQESQMISKLYELWSLANQDEKDKETYSKKSTKARTAETTEEVLVSDMDSGIGGGFGGSSSAAAGVATASKK